MAEKYITSLDKPITYWQYKNSKRLVSLLADIKKLFDKYYPCEIWELLNLDTATGYALDIIGERLGYPRPREVVEAIGQYDLSRYQQAYYDGNLDDLQKVKDDTYRYMLKIRVMMWQAWHGISITSFYEALAFAFPGIDFWLKPRDGQKVMDLYILSFITYPQRRALFSDVLKAPLGQTLLIHDVYDNLQFLTDNPGTKNNLIVNPESEDLLLVSPLG